jgi:hypothetical protein
MLLDDLAGAMLFEAQFGVGVQIAAQRRDGWNDTSDFRADEVGRDWGLGFKVHRDSGRECGHAQG